MTEREWLKCTRPKAMLEFLEGKVSDRKLRLFACACCRSIWHLLREPCLRAAVEATEDYADGKMAVELLTEISEAAWDTKYRLEETETDEEDDEAVFCAASAVAQASCGPGDRETPFIFRAMDVSSFTCAAGGLSTREQAHLLRALVGPLPFRPAVLGPLCRTTNLLSLAQAAYEERELPSGHLCRTRLAILADALEEAGCDSAELLDHLRGPGPHVRGCHVLDAILGKS